MQKHPQIAELYKLYLSETQPFRKVHRLIDLFESIIKTHTVLIVSEYVQHNKLSEAAKGLLAQGLRTPSLGTWQLFSRVLFTELVKEGFNGFFPSFEMDFVLSDNELYSQITKGKIEFPAFDKKQIAELKKQKKKRLFFFDDVIAFRNGIAHGATPNDNDCLEDIKKYDPFLRQLLEMQWLKDSALLYKNSKVHMTGVDSEICLHPLIIYKDEGDKPPFAFFNDLKNDKIGLLNYPLSKHYREKDFWHEFHEYLPLHDWKKSGNNEFYQRIEELTETFKGRQKERAELLNFVLTKNKGYFSVLGNPGIGKSALIAQFFKDLKAKEETKNLLVVEYFIRRGTAQAQVDHMFNYLIKRTDEIFPAGREIRAEGKMIFDIQQQLFNKWRLWSESSKGQKLLFLIDGLDEGVENNLPYYLPRENFENILIIYGSRPGGHRSIDELWASLPVEYHDKRELSGLSKEDIRALIYEVSNKYEIERESAWIDAVQARSQGNPLYLKLLCDALENGSIKLNDIKALPEKIEEYYKAILQRYAQDTLDGDALLAGLYSIAAAKDYLTMPHLGLINQIGDAALERIGSTLKEVLYENPLTVDVLDYQLFHESFREYLYKEKGKQIQDASERIIDFCASWRELEGSYEQRYALEHYAGHLSESKKEARILELLALLKNESYIQTQKKVLKQFDATSKLYQLSLQKATEQKDYNSQLEAALSLVDLKYEEANDAPQIVALVAEGYTDLALKRIDSFAGNDEEGLQRKFTLYMLCLMELTLLDSKEMPHSKKSIEKILNHLDEKIPVDHSILKWNDFFPSYLMFKMACEWAELGVDYGVLYKRTDNWDSEWIGEKGPYSDVQFDVLREAAFCSSSEWVDNTASQSISCELAKQGKVEEALSFARGISEEMDKSCALRFVSSELAKQGKAKEAASVVREALLGARGISSKSTKSSVIASISSELVKQGKEEEAVSVMNEALACARGIIDESDKSSTIRFISSELAKQRKFKEALVYARDISDEKYKSSALQSISSELANQGKVDEALVCARGISYEINKSRSLQAISSELAKQGKIEEAASVMQETLLFARGISDDWSKIRSLQSISSELAKQGKFEEAESVLQEALSCARGISDDWRKSRNLKNISSELAKQGKFEEAHACARDISDKWIKSSALKNISSELAKQGKFKEAASVMHEALTCTRGISSEVDKSWALQSISIELAKQEKEEEALSCARGISFERNKSRALQSISSELAKQGKVKEAASAMQEALACACEISNKWKKSIALQSISSELAKQGKVKKAASAMQEALLCARGISSESSKSSALQSISSELAKQGKVKEAVFALQEALACARCISDESDKSSALQSISSELAKQGKVEEALSLARIISDYWYKSWALKDISSELAKQGNYPLAEEIPQIATRHKCWKEIAQSLKKQHCWEKSLELLEEFKSDDSRTFYLKGWVESITLKDMSEALIQKALPALEGDRDSIEALLQLYSIHQLFFENPGKEKIARFNKTLNIQWALDIKSQFPVDAALERRTDNLEEWIEEIGDEDDRAQIELWANKVNKGKMTEEEFGEKVRGL